MREIERGPSTGSRALTVVGAMAVVIVGLTGCSDNTTEPVGASQGASSDFCAAMPATEIAFTRSHPEVAGLPSLDDEAKASALQDLTERLAEVNASAPAEVTRAARTLTDAIGTFIDSGSFDAFEREFRDAEETIDRFVDEHCALPSVGVEADEYAFTGMPETLSPGTTSFALNNAGEEAHEATVFKIADGAHDRLAELNITSAVPAGLTFAGSTFRPPGGTDITYLDLTPGRYAVVCLVQVGASAAGPPPPGAPPHLALGMVAEFEVTTDAGASER